MNSTLEADQNVYARTFTLPIVAGDNCVRGHHGHYPGDACRGRSADGFHHDNDGDFAGDIRHLNFFKRR